MARKLVVWIEEEYGYRYWKWEVSMKLDAFLDWWRNLETVDTFFFDPGKTLPFGKVNQVEWKDFKKVRFLYMHLHCDDDSFLFINGSESHHPSEKIFHKGYAPNEFGE